MKFLTNIFYVLCLPSFLLHPLPATPLQTTPNPQETVLDIPIDEFGMIDPWALLQPENLSIDRYFAFIELACDETFLETLSEKEFDRVVDFVTTMLRFSAPESDEDLIEAYDHDIEELLEDLYGDQKWNIAYSYGFDFKFAPPLSFVKTDVSLCKNWFGRKSHHFEHWCEKHKKPLIAGAVVVGVVAVAIVTGGVGGSSAAAVGGGIIDNTYREDRKDRGDCTKYINKPGEVYIDHRSQQIDTPSLEYKPIQTIEPIFEPTSLEQAQVLSFEKVEEAKLEIAEQTQNILETSEKNSVEKAKGIAKTVVSNIVHDIFEGISKIGTVWHEIYSNSDPEGIQAYKEYVAAQHEKIDETFGTYRPDYTLESQEYAEAYKAAIIDELGHYPEMQIGELPPPGALINAASRAATVASRAIGIVAKNGSAIGSAAVIGSMIDWEAPISKTLVNDTIGWKVGDPIQNQTIQGKTPKWSTVRCRYWKNEALDVENGVITKALDLKCYRPTEENLKRMGKGLAPQIIDKKGKIESIELHHDPTQRDGGLFDFTPMTPAQHAKVDPSRHTGY